MSRQIIRITLLVAFAVGILVLSLLPKPPFSATVFIGMDKIQHWIAYTVLGFLVFLTIRGPGLHIIFYVGLSVFSCTMYGGLIEVLQGFVGRSPEIADFFVNLFGAIAGSIFGLGFFQMSMNGKKQRQKGGNP